MTHFSRSQNKGIFQINNLKKRALRCTKLQVQNAVNFSGSTFSDFAADSAGSIHVGVSNVFSKRRDF